MPGTGAEKVCTLRARIADLIGSKAYTTWFGESVDLSLAQDTLEIAVSNSFVGQWISSNYMPQLVSATRDVLGSEPRVEVRVRAGARPASESSAAAPSWSAARPARAAGRAVLRGDLDNFVVGPSNELAHSVARSVAEAPGQAYKHVVVHGGCGLGKTHLLHGICNGLAKRHPTLEWCYVSGEEFTNEFIYNVKGGRIDLFRARFRRADLLVIDDIHFLANKRGTQEEFLHTFNAIDASGRTVVLASDRHPRSITELAEPLLDRLLAAMIVQIQPPDFETRCEILRRRAAAMRVQPTPDVVQFLARQIARNVRELEGALYRLVAFASLTREPIGLDLARRALHEYLPDMRPPEASDIEQAVAAHFELAAEALRSKSRDRTVALARGIAMYLIRAQTKFSFPEIGRLTGHKNHSTVLMAVRRIQKLADTDGVVTWKTSSGAQEAPLKQVLESIERRLRRGASGQA